jgi:prepilin-type N-terminal cleavage/methylation domain-containing protein
MTRAASPKNRRRRGRGTQERGDTLIEVVLAIAIVSVTAVAGLGGLATTLAGSAEHRSLATINADLTTSAERAKYDIELRPDGPWFTDCISQTFPSNTYAGHSLELAGTVTLTGISFFNPSTGSLDQICSPSDIPGFQELTFTDTSNGFSQTLTIAVRAPN